MKHLSINSKLLLYSKSLVTGKEVATFVLTIPKFIQAHINSHRSLSRNAGSSRAIPTKVLRRRILSNPYIPIKFSSRQRGMRGGRELFGLRLFFARKIWLYSRYAPCLFHYFGEKIGLQKEIVNRIIEPWMWTQVVVTSTEWNNFIKLRTNENAQPETRKIAIDIRQLLKTSKPQILKTGEWHLPFIQKNEMGQYDLEMLKKISTARCARVSYQLPDGSDSNPEKDIELCDKLLKNGHWSPFEHVAVAMEDADRFGNFVGFKQYRKFFKSENGGDYEK